MNQIVKIDLKKKAEDLIHLLDRTSVEEWFEKNTGCHFVRSEMEKLSNEIKTLYETGLINNKVGGTFILPFEKPKCTEGKGYKIFRKIEDEDGIEYWFYNDYGKPAVIYESDFLTQNR